MSVICLTAIQYWTTNYLTDDLKFDPTVIFVAFVVTSLSAPTAGIIVGGALSKNLGDMKQNMHSLSVHYLE